MSEQTVSTRQIVRSLLVAAFIVMLALTTAQRAGANQSGPGVNDPSQFQKALCEAAGGTATIEVFRTVGSGLTDVQVNCKGGLLDGLRCDNHTDPQFGTVCAFLNSGPSGGGSEGPTAGVDDVAVDHVLTQDDEIVDSSSSDQPSIEQSTPQIVEVDANADQAEDPASDSGDGQVADQPGTVDESVEPVVADDPVIEDVPVVEPTFETMDVQELPVFIGQ